MLTKIRMTISKSLEGHVAEINTDVIVQDCNLQLSKDQYDSIIAVISSLQRMMISWQFLSARPVAKVLKNEKAWWK